VWRLTATACLAFACSVDIDYGDPPASPGIDGGGGGGGAGDGGSGIDAPGAPAIDARGSAPADAVPLPPDGAPNVILTVGERAEDVRETEVNAGAPDFVHGFVDHLSVDGGEVGLIWFALPQFPAGTTIVSVSLKVTTMDTASPDGGSVLVERVRESWAEDAATWYERQQGTPWATEGAGPPSRDDVSLVELYPQSTETTYAVPLPNELIEEWIADPDSNCGLALVRGTSMDHVHIRTRESGAGWPLLEIEYR